jgi:Carboxypeptidase regulatory-like domain
MRHKLIFPAAAWTIAAALLFAANGVRAMPQSHSATLAGVVLGPDDKPVANASVTYESGGGNAPHVVRTDVHGRFLIAKLRADNYDVRASSKGIFSEWEKNITVRPGQTKTVTLRLIYAKEMPKVGPA